MCRVKKFFTKQNIFDVLRLSLLGAVVGALGGGVGSLFLYALSLANSARAAHPFLIFLLPLGGIATVYLYRLLRLSDHGGVNELISNAENGTRARFLAAPLIFICTVITHLLGGSAGKEGAALQLGGALTSPIAKAFKLNEKQNSVLILCGMCALFAAAFGTPLTAVFFVLEFSASRKNLPLNVIPCLVSAFIAQKAAALLGHGGEAFYISGNTSFSVLTLARVILLALLISAVGYPTCFIWSRGKIFAKKLIKNPLIRIATGALAVVLLTVIVGDMRYNGAGMDMAAKALEGSAAPYDFALKILFTALTVTVGFKGGEIVPTFCVGATFGCVAGGMLGLDPALSAAIGLAALFSFAANSLFGAIILSLELFGIGCLPYAALACLIAFALPNKYHLFSGRNFRASTIFKKRKAAES